MTNLTSPDIGERTTGGVTEAPPAETPADHETIDSVTRGRSSATPFVLLSGVTLVIAVVVAVVLVAAMLVWWLV